MVKLRRKPIKPKLDKGNITRKKILSVKKLPKKDDSTIERVGKVELRILALDVATRTGWCMADGSGYFDSKAKKDESNGIRLLRFRSRFIELLKLGNINFVVFERTAGHHVNAIKVQIGFQTIIEQHCLDNDIPYTNFIPSEIKKFATGKGNAGKPAMIKAAQEKYGWKGTDDNEADAIHLYHLTKQEYGV